MNITIVIVIIIIILVLILKCHNYICTNSFNDLLKLRRKLERVEGFKEHIIIDNSNINKYKNNDYFYSLIDSGNIGSKSNSDFYANYLGIKLIEKYYIGKLKDINIPNDIENFIIKPYNLSSSQGLLLIKNREDIVQKKKFNSNDEIIKHYKMNYIKNDEQIIIVQKFINSKIRPPELKVYSFGGKVGILNYVKWISETKRKIAYYTKDWIKLHGDNIEKPSKLIQMMNDSNLYTKNLKTFMRIDFLIDEFTGDYYFCEVSSYPLCANKFFYPTLKIDKYLYNFWENNFPYNKYSVKEVQEKTKNYNKKELCENFFIN